MSNLIRINNKLMTKNNKLLTANSGSSGLAYNNNLLKFNNYVIDPSNIVPLWVDLPNEYIAQGGATRSIALSLTGMPQSSDSGYFTMIFEAKICGSTDGAARLLLGNASMSNPYSNLNNADRWAMYDHFSLPADPAFYIYTSTKLWSTDPDATQYITVRSDTINTSLWPENTYKLFKIAVDRTNRICYLYIDNIYLGTAYGFSVDPLTWNTVYLYSDQNLNTELAAIKSIKVVGFDDLTSARTWNG